MALRLISLARSRMRIASAFCSSVESPGLLGQSMLPTVATQTARNSSGAGGGSSPFIFAPLAAGIAGRFRRLALGARDDELLQETVRRQVSRARAIREA